MNLVLRLFFVHVPKTAGTSLRSALAAAVGRQRSHFVSTRAEIRDFARNVGDPSSRRIVGGHYELPRARDFIATSHLSWKPFTVLRDPLRRLASEYAYLTTGGHAEHAHLEGMPFEDFARDQARTYRSMCRWLARDARYESAHRALLESDVTVFRVAKFDAMLDDLSRALGRRVEHRRLLVSPSIPELGNEGLARMFAGLREDYLLLIESLKGTYRSSLLGGRSRPEHRPLQMLDDLEALRQEVLAAPLAPEALAVWQSRIDVVEAALPIRRPRRAAEVIHAAMVAAVARGRRGEGPAV